VKTYHAWPIVFDPADQFIPDSPAKEATVRAILLGSGRKSLQLHAARHPHTWAITLPLGLLGGRLALKEEEAGPRAQELAETDRRAEQTLFHRITERLHAAPVTRQVRQHGDKRFYSIALLRAILAVTDNDQALWESLVRFVASANADESLIKSREDRHKKIKPLKDPSKRGRNWTRDEDNILHQWFRKQDDGTRFQLKNDDEWALFLKHHLNGRFTREQVFTRLTYLNSLLKKSLVGPLGKLSPDDRVKYNALRLGQLNSYNRI